MTTRDDALLIDKEHPWPWLDAFPESARAFFNGRDEAAQQLLRCVLAAPATVLFGKSGLGKTSLVQAGLSPLLREEQLLPVLVRLTHDSSYQPGRLSARLLARMDEEAAAHGLRCERPPLPEGTASTKQADAAAPPEANAASRLWEQLHDSEAQWLDAQGEEWTPVFILDQFEEAFTLLHDAEAQQRLFSELGNLIQNRTPAEVAERRKAHEPLRRRLDPERLAARFVLSLREDYLPDLEIHADRIPRLGPNRYRLLPMSQTDALQAIDTTGGALVDTADAERIVQFLDQQNQQPADASRPRTQRRERIEPALLSLVCAGLNQHRIEKKAAQLDTRSLDQLGGQLLEQFYDRALATLPEQRREAAARFVETELITLDGTRRPFPEVSLARVGLTTDDIATLKDKRLLRTENTEHGAFVELVHDRLAVVATERAALSRQRAEAARADAEAAEAARHKQAQRKAFAWVSSIIFAVTLIGLAGVLLQWQKARELSSNLAQTIEKLDKTNKEQEQTLYRAVAAERQASVAALEAVAKASEARSEAERALHAETEAKNNLEQSNVAKLRAIAAEEQAFAATQKALSLASEATNETARAQRAEADAKHHLQLANAAIRQAEASAIDAIAQRVLSDANDFFGGINRPSTGLQTLLMTLAGDRIAKRSDKPFVQDAGYSATQREVIRSSPQIWLQEAGAPVQFIAISPDGSRIASANSDKTLRIWDARTGAAVGRPLHGHSAPVLSAAFSPDGSRIVSGSSDKTLRLWDARTGAAIGQPLLGHSDAVRSVAFSPDGSIVASGSRDSTLRLWSALSGAPFSPPLLGHSRTVTGVAFSPDGKNIVSGSADKTLRLWDVRSGKPFGQPLLGHSEPVSSVAFTPDGKTVVSGGYDDTVRLWDARSGRPIGQPLQGHSSIVLSVAVSPDGSHIVSGSSDKTLRLWDARSGTPIGEPLMGHSEAVESVAFEPDGKTIVSGSSDKTLRLWHARTHTALSQPLQGHLDLVWCVAFSFDGSRIVSGSSDKTLRLWDARSGTQIGQPLQGHSSSVSSVAFSPDGSRIVSGSWDKTLRLWDARSGTPIGEPLQGHSSIVLSVAVSPDGSRIVSGGWDTTLRLWDARSGTPIGEPMKGHSDAVRSVAFSPDGSRIVSGSRDRTVRQWDARSNAPIGQPLYGHSGSVSSVAYSPDGSRIISSSEDNTLRLWDTHSGASIGQPLHGHSGGVNSVAFSPDGLRIVSGGGSIFSSSDNTLRLWDSRSGAPIGQPLYGHSDEVYSVAFSPDGSRIVSGGLDKTLRLWPVLDAWADILCAKLPRNMSHKEWREWVSPDIEYIVQCPGKPVPAD